MSISEHRRIIRQYQQTWLGILFILVTPLSILPGLPFFNDNPVNWWNSVSQSYYANSGMIMIYIFLLVGGLALVYRAKNLPERIGMSLLGLSSMAIVAFPHAFDDFSKTGFFHLSGALSTKIHYVVAAIFFSCMTFNSFVFSLRFKDEDDEIPYKKRIFYIASTALMLIFSILILFTRQKMVPSYFVLISEFVMFTLYGLEFLFDAGKINL